MKSNNTLSSAASIGLLYAAWYITSNRTNGQKIFLFLVLGSYFVAASSVTLYGLIFYLQSPPQLEVPLQLIGKDTSTKDVNWEDDGVLINSINMDIF